VKLIVAETKTVIVMAHPGLARAAARERAAKDRRSLSARP
jgi:hypothetical protein